MSFRFSTSTFIMLSLSLTTAFTANLALGEVQKPPSENDIVVVNPLNNRNLLNTSPTGRSHVIESLLPPREFAKGPLSVERLYTSRIQSNDPSDSGDILIPFEPSEPRRRWRPPASRSDSAFSGAGNSKFDLALDVPAEFQCALFENPDYSTTLAAIQSLNQAVNSPSCHSEKLNPELVLANTKKVSDLIQKLLQVYKNQGPLEGSDPTLLSRELNSEIDSAILAALDVATTVSDHSLFKENCTPATSGRMALAINDLINGLTPVALAAASSTGVGSAAIPFLIGGSAVSTAISSLNRAFHESDLNLDDPNIRKAILENTCQLVKVTQRQQFVLYERSHQITKISEEINQGAQYLEAAVQNLPPEVSQRINSYAKREWNVDRFERQQQKLTQDYSTIREKFQGPSSHASLCSFGQFFVRQKPGAESLPFLAASLARQIVQSSSTTITPAAQGALETHQQIATRLRSFQNSIGQMGPREAQRCADNSKTWLENIQTLLDIANALIVQEKSAMEAIVKNDPDYATYRSLYLKLRTKQLMGDRVLNAMDMIKEHSSAFLRSDMDDELIKLRRGLLTGAPRRILGVSLPLPKTRSPVDLWFAYKFEKFDQKMMAFSKGLQTLRTLSANVIRDNKIPFRTISDVKAARYHLKSLNSKYLKANTPEYDHVCKELQGTWFQYVSAVDHLASTELFCNMLKPIIYDQNNSDSKLVHLCDGQRLTNSNQRLSSKIDENKNWLIKGHHKAWAIHVWNIMNALKCPTNLL